MDVCAGMGRLSLLVVLGVRGEPQDVIGEFFEKAQKNPGIHSIEVLIDIVISTAYMFHGSPFVRRLPQVDNQGFVLVLITIQV